MRRALPRTACAAAAGLVDEYHLLTFPVVVGSGKRLFASAAPAGLKLVDSATSPNGVTIATYVPAGELVTGTFGA